MAVSFHSPRLVDLPSGSNDWSRASRIRTSSGAGHLSPPRSMRRVSRRVLRSAFAESCGVAVDALQKLDEGKGSFLFFIGTKPGAAATELLPQIVQASLDALPIPRRMHWGSGTAEFVRPVHWLVMLYGKDVLPARLLETEAGNQTQGHRFHAPKPIRISSPAAYERALRERGYVLPDFAKRRDLIRSQGRGGGHVAGRTRAHR